MPPGPLIEAVRRVSLVAERGSPVRLAFTDDEVVIEAGTQGQARATERVPAVFAGEERIIAFNPQYLLDGLTAAAVAAGHAGRLATADTGQAADAAGKTMADAAGRMAADAGKTTADAGKTTADAGKTTADAAGRTAQDTAARTAAARGGSIRLEFTSAVRPAVITWAPGEPAAEAPGQQPASAAAPAEPDFRYLVVPLRIPGDT
jgi:hypothetical protein